MMHIDYGAILVSSAILAGFLGFGSLVSLRFRPMVYTAGNTLLKLLYACVVTIIGIPLGIMILAVAGIYLPLVHAIALAVMLALIVFIVVLIVRLRVVENRYYSKLH